MPAERARIRRIVSLGLNYFRSNEFDLPYLADHGTDMVRLNFSHVDLEKVQECTERLRRDYPAVKILQDLQGQKWRVAKSFILGEQRVGRGEGAIFCSKEMYPSLQKQDPRTVHVPIEMEGDFAILKSVETISMKDGMSEFQVLDNQSARGFIKAVALDAVVIRAEKSINIPEAARADLSAMTVKDKQDILWGIKNQADVICLSFVNKAQDMVEFREYVESHLSPGQKRPALWAKIETRDGRRNFASILPETDGIMLGRGDLLPEVGRFEASMAQYEMLSQFKKLKRSGQDFVVATHVLDSLMSVHEAQPSIANLNDILQSVRAGATGFMLTNEVGYGKQPKAAIKILDDYLQFIEIQTA